MPAHGGYLPSRHFLCVWETPNTKTEKQRNNLIRACFLGKDSVTKWPKSINNLLDGHFCEPVTMLTQQLSPLVCLQPNIPCRQDLQNSENLFQKRRRGNMFFLFWKWFLLGELICSIFIWPELDCCLWNITLLLETWKWHLFMTLNIWNFQSSSYL